MNFSVERLPPFLSFGAIVRGLSQSEIEQKTVRGSLYDLWIKEGLILFRGGQVDVDFQIALSRCFGRLQHHSIKEVQVQGRSDLIQIKYEPENARGTDIA